VDLRRLPPTPRTVAVNESFRATWFAPDRPVDGTTVYTRGDLAGVDELLDAEQRQGAGRDVPHPERCTDLVDDDERDQ